MRVPVGELWGSGRGVISRCAPEVRLGAGVLVAAACLVVPPDTPLGAISLALSVLGWMLLCGAPARVLRPALVAGLIMLVPFFALTPWVHAGGVEPWWSSPDALCRALAVPWSILAKGLSTMLVSVATVTTLRVSDWHEGLSRLPLPRVLVALLAQIVHQAALLVGETRRMAAAMAVRGATGRVRGAIRLLAALPRVWLPRILERAERTAASMEVRGLGLELPRFRLIQRSWRDAVAVLTASVWLCGAIALRLEVGP